MKPALIMRTWSIIWLLDTAGSRESLVSFQELDGNLTNSVTLLPMLDFSLISVLTLFSSQKVLISKTRNKEQRKRHLSSCGDLSQSILEQANRSLSLKLMESTAGSQTQVKLWRRSNTTLLLFIHTSTQCRTQSRLMWLYQLSTLRNTWISSSTTFIRSIHSTDINISSSHGVATWVSSMPTLISTKWKTGSITVTKTTNGTLNLSCHLHRHTSMPSRRNKFNGQWTTEIGIQCLIRRMITTPDSSHQEQVPRSSSRTTHQPITLWLTCLLRELSTNNPQLNLWKLL